MIELYEKTQRDFSNHGHVLQDVYNDTVTWKMNETFTLQFDYPLTSPHGFELTREKIITVPVPSTFEHNQAFRIYDVKKSMGVATVYARHVFWDLMQNLVEDTNVVDKNGQLALDQILGGGNYASEFEATSNLANTATARIVRMSVVSALIGTDDNTFLKRWGGEFEWDNWTFRVADKIGADRGVVFSNRKNLLGYTAEDNTDTVITRIMPEGYNGLFLPEKYVDSPLINNYLKPRVAVVPFTDIKAIDENTASDDEDAVPLEEAYELMRKAAAEKFSVDHIDEPSTTVSLNVVLLENSDEYKGKGLFSKVYPGDTARFVHDEDKMDTTAEMTGYTWSPVQGEYMTVTFESSATTTSPITGPTISSVARQVTSIDQNVIVKAQDGIHQTEWSDKDPTDADPGVDGDVWYVQDGSAIAMWVHENGHWALKNDDVTGQKIQKKVDDAFAQIPVLEANIDTAMQLAQDNVAKFADQDASIKAINDLVTGAKTDAANAADQAISALNSANSAAADAASALQVAQGTNSDIKSIRTDVDSINATMSTLATDEKVNALTGTVNTVKTQSEQNANALLFKADQTVVTGISDKLGSLGTRNYYSLAARSSDASYNDPSGGVWVTRLQLQPNTAYTVSTDIPKANSTICDCFAYLTGDHSSSSTNGVAVNEPRTVVTGDDGVLIVGSRSYDINGGAAHIMVQIGQMATDWAPAVEDQATVSALNTLQATVNKTSTSLDITNQQLALKADKTITDGINQTINDISAKQVVQAGLIDTMATKTYVDTSTAGMATESYVSGEIKVASDQISNTVSAVKNKLDGLNIGGTNLLTGTKSEYQKITGYVWGDYVAATNGKTITLVPGESYTYTVFLTSKATVRCYARVYKDNDRKTYTDFNGTQVTAGTSGYSTVTFTVPNGTWYGVDFMTVRFVYQQSNPWEVDYKEEKLEKGNVATAWSLAPEDTATVTALTNVSQTVDQVKVMATDNQNDLTSLTVKVNGWQTTVTDKLTGMTNTQTSLANQLTSTIANTSMISNIFPDPTFDIGGHLPVTEGTGWTVKYDNTDLFLENKGSVMQRVYWTGFTSPYSSYAVKLYANGNGGTYDIQVGFAEGDEHIAHMTGPDPLDFAFSVNSNKYGAFSIWIPAGQAIRVRSLYVFRNVAGISSSQFTQLQNLISANVTVAGKIAAQLSLSADGGGTALLAGNHVHITGATTIDSAVIKDGMIDTMSANKITAGTIDASQVNVVNINASNITTGSITGANLSINLNTGKVEFQKGSISSTDGSLDINIDEGYIALTNNYDHSILIKDGQLQFTQPNIFDPTQGEPYMSISNDVVGNALHGASLLGRDYVAMSTNENMTSSLFGTDSIMGTQTFAGFGVGKNYKTVIGGATRGVFISGGQQIKNSDALQPSPSISIGSDAQGVNSGNRIVLKGEYVHAMAVQYQTTSGSANVFVANDGALVRVTSALKYKDQVERTYDDTIAERLITLPTATWIDKAERNRYNSDPAHQPVPERHFGMIAEDLAAAGIEELVVRGLDGELEGIEYDRIGPALVPLIKKLYDRVKKLEELQNEATA